ncbi:MAG: acyl-CoA desaturase [Prochloraceae cyanobacterium]|nr:acyl-CoA desaturase [Prochloraceae cyanobacterium]
METNQKQRVTFSKNIGFRKELNRRVDEYFTVNNIRKKDNPAMYFKTAIIFSWIIGAWAFVIFVPAPMLIKALGCVVLGLGIAACGMSVGHDANHGAYSYNSTVNKAIGLTYDFIGVSNFIWRFRHNVLHHNYTNLKDYDAEIRGDGVVRMSPNNEHKPHQRFQHLFIWFIYLIIPFYWYLNEFKLIIFQESLLGHKIPQLKVTDLIAFWGMRFLSLCFFIGIPLLLGYGPLQIFIGLSIAYMSYGLVACEIFMLAHVLEGLEFPEPDPKSNTIEDEWAVFQLKTTADFAPHNPILNWYVGGLNYQAIHHLFPQICHIHYPKIAPIVAEVAKEFGVNYQVYPTFSSAFASNYRWLKLMGNPEVKREVSLG